MVHETEAFMAVIKKLVTAISFLTILVSNSLIFADILPTFKLWNRSKVPIQFEYENNRKKSGWHTLKPGQSFATAKVNPKYHSYLFINQQFPDENLQRTYRYNFLPGTTNIYVFYTGETESDQKSPVLYREKNKLNLGPLSFKKNIREEKTQASATFEKALNQD